MVDDNETPILDQLNPFIIYNGLGDMSKLAMQGYQRHPYLDKFKHGVKGGYDKLQELVIPSGKLNYPHQVHVYLPPDYNNNNDKYPVIYFQDGRDYIEFAVVPHILNLLIEENKIEPVIAVFVTPPNRFMPD